MGTLRALVVVCIGAALAGCPTVDLGDTPEGIASCNPMGGLPYFQDQIWPMYLNSSDPTKTCIRSGCHDKTDSAGGMGYDPTVPIDYADNYAVAQVQLSCGNPTSSLLLTKPLDQMSGHGGGQIFTMSDPEYSIFLNWFQ
jgi:hypothetical protein